MMRGFLQLRNSLHLRLMQSSTANRIRINVTIHSTRSDFSVLGLGVSSLRASNFSEALSAGGRGSGAGHVLRGMQ